MRLSSSATQPETRVANNVVSRGSGSRNASPLAALRERGATVAERFLTRQHSSGTLAAITAAHGAAAARGELSIWLGFFIPHGVPTPLDTKNLAQPFLLLP